MVELVVSQGRVADRTEGAIRGALLTGQALAERTGRPVRTVGRPSDPRADGWQEALVDAAPTLDAVGEAVGAVLDAGRVPVMVASTCATSVATLPLVARHRPGVVVVWIDAHADFNTPDTTWSGYLGGMVLAAGCGLWDSGYGCGVDPRDVVLVGARDVDDAEQELLREHGVRVLAPAEATPERLAEIVGDREVWFHVDWDVLEPGAVPAAYRVPGGLTPEQVGRLLAAVPAERVAGVELAEFEASGTPADEDAVAAILRAVEPLVAGLTAQEPRG